MKRYLKDDRYIVKSLIKALDLLETFKQNSEQGVSEISRVIDASKSTVFTLLHTLKKRGYIYQNPETRKYMLGLKLLEIGEYVRENDSLRVCALPKLKELVERYNETAPLVFWNGVEACYVDKVEGTASMRMVYQLGKTPPLHCTANGKAILACLSNEKVRKIIEIQGMEEYTKNTITNIEDLLEELELTRRRGYSTDNSEEEIGVSCVAVPIRDYGNSVIGAVSLSGSSARINQDNVPLIAEDIKKAVNEIQVALGKYN
jgi:IclR family KDG regulon transcriptional repressor